MLNLSQIKFALHWTPEEHQTRHPVDPTSIKTGFEKKKIKKKKSKNEHPPKERRRRRAKKGCSFLDEDPVGLISFYLNRELFQWLHLKKINNQNIFYNFKDIKS